MKWKTSYKGYLITSLTTMNEYGRYEARVCVIAVSNSRMRSQRFLDLEEFSSEAMADDVWAWCATVNAFARTVTVKVKFSNFHLVTWRDNVDHGFVE